MSNLLAKELIFDISQYYCHQIYLLKVLSDNHDTEIIGMFRTRKSALIEGARLMRKYINNTPNTLVDGQEEQLIWNEFDDSDYDSHGIFYCLRRKFWTRFRIEYSVIYIVENWMVNP